MELFPDKLYAEVVAGLRDIGYQNSLLEEDYKFADWFSPGMEEREVAAAAFGQTPISYDSACIGVAKANGFREQTLVNRYRALGAPILLEISNNEVREWAVSRTENAHGLIATHSAQQVRQMLVNRAPEWKPQSLMRAKNIGTFHWTRQFSLFAGLLPELEEHIQATLEPLLRDALSATKDVYRESSGRDANPARLFKLIFWILTAKVFHDRRANGFATISPDPDAILSAVAKQYREEVPRLLNQEAREVAVSRIWSELDFRNLSVEVLSQMWPTLLVDDDIKRRLGIHRTSRTIVRYIVERIPFQQSGDDKRIILEPCSGSAVFLIGAMNVLRHNLFGMTPAERHKYFIEHLAGIEKDPFGVEISRLALTLADFPNPGGWKIEPGDVYESGVLTGFLQRAGVVLCNPPFHDFDLDERNEYQLSSTKRPVELLHRVLNDLHQSGVIGFVLPRNIIDGRGYAEIRKRLAKRFAKIELTILPDRAFEADPEIGLLIATEPIPHDTCQITNRKVNDDAQAWEQFELKHEVSSEHVADFSIDEATERFAIPELPELWEFLIGYPTLGEVAELHRGIEWNRPLTKDGAEAGHWDFLVRNTPTEGYKRGVAPQTTFCVFDEPHMFYLNMRPEDQRRNAYKYDWDKPKAILNKSTRSRGKWRMAAFPDSEGVTCYQTYFGIWPTSDRFDEWALAAVLNSPLANAFVYTREGKTDITKETLNLIPVPYLTESQRAKLKSLIKQYREIISTWPVDSDKASRLLMEIDATVLDGYRMPPELENRLLSFFHGQIRPTSHDFEDYLPPDNEVYFSLSERLSPKFKKATVGELLKRTGFGQEG